MFNKHQHRLRSKVLDVFNAAGLKAGYTHHYDSGRDLTNAGHFIVNGDETDAVEIQYRQPLPGQWYHLSRFEQYKYAERCRVAVRQYADLLVAAGFEVRFCDDRPGQRTFIIVKDKGITEDMNKASLESLKLVQVASAAKVGVRISNSLWSGYRNGAMQYDIPAPAARVLLAQGLIERGTGMQAERYFLSTDGEAALMEISDGKANG